MAMKTLIGGLLIALAAGVCDGRADDLRIATFNTESDPAFTTWPVNVAKTITKIGRFDILAVREVESEEALKLYAAAAAHSQGGDWRYVISESGTNGAREPDLLGIIYSTKLFRQLGTSEIHSIRSRPGDGTYGKPDWSLRGALLLRMQHIATGQEFQVATVHLKCCNEPAVRAHQAAILKNEIVATSLPTILLGDTNIPIEPGATAPTGDNLEAFDSLTTGANLAWVQPSNPVKTQCSPSFNSMLDQIYGPAGATASAEILFPEAAYCEREEDGWADHRPMRAVFEDFLVEHTVESETAAPAARRVTHLLPQATSPKKPSRRIWNIKFSKRYDQERSQESNPSRWRLSQVIANVQSVDAKVPAMPILFCNIAWMNSYAGQSPLDPPFGRWCLPARRRL